MKLLIGVLFVTGVMFWAINSLYNAHYPQLHDSKGNDENPQNSLDSSSHKMQKIRDEEFKRIEAKAKSISHSKGHIVNVEGKMPEYRRSLTRKIEIKTKSYSLKKVLNILQNCTEQERLAPLQALELLVHQYEIAIDFVNNGGLDLIIPLFEEADEKIISAALSVLSAAMQGNPVVQKKVAESKLYDVLDILMANLAREAKNYKSLLYTISSFLRNMPESQKKFLEEGGIFLLTDIILNDNSALKLKLHAITILADIAYEIIDDSSMNYEKVALLQLFVKDVQLTDVCQTITGFLDSNESYLKKAAFRSEYLIHEKIIYAMIALDEVCAHEFKQSLVKNAVEKLILRYDPYAKLAWNSAVDNELKISIHKDLIKFYEKMYLKRDFKKRDL